MHHGFDAKRVRAKAISDGIRKPAEVELAVVSLEFAPPFWFGDEAAQRAFEPVNEVTNQTRLPLIIP